MNIKSNFNLFLIKSFKEINPNIELSPNWHIELIAEKLEECSRFKIPRLLINIPPRSLKSVITSVAWPAWVLLNDPTARIINASYSQIISNRLTSDFKKIITSNWYQDLFTCGISSITKERITTKSNGFRFATSVGGSITGDGGDYLIIDDPQNPSKINSQKYRESTIDWFENTFSSRLNNRSKGSIILVMQRLHEDDLSGYIIKNKNWENLIIPQISEENEKLINKNIKYERNTEEILNRKRDDINIIKTIKQEMGAYGFSSQHQQQPIPLEGSLINRNNIFFSNETNINFSKIIQSWDCAVKANLNSDYSVCTTWGIYQQQYYLLDVNRKKMQFPEMREELISLAHKYGPNLILIEDHASGSALIQDVKNNQPFPILPIRPKGNKIERFSRVSHFFETSKVIIKDNQPWKDQLLKEMLAFPNGKNDDQIDSITQFLNYIFNLTKEHPARVLI